jgi:hypothetical protein
MATITTIQETDLITNSRADINNNFTALNSDKIETSTLDTDTTLAADSDAKIATQKAVKAYVDSGGNQNASETNRGVVQEATDAQVTAGTATGSTGAKLFITPAKLKSAGLPVVKTYTYTSVGATTTRFDITNPAGTTFRYTFDGTGTDPVINTTTFPVGTQVFIKGSTLMSVENQGYFVVTASGTNYFEVTNASGVAENDKTLANGYLLKNSDLVWTKPTGLKYAVVEVQGGGGGGAGCDTDHTGDLVASSGGAGGYAKKLIVSSSLGTTETITVGAGGLNGASSASPTSGLIGGTTSFGAICSAAGGAGGIKPDAGDDSEVLVSEGGVATGGDINITGGASFGTQGRLSHGGDSMLGKGGVSISGTDEVETAKSEATGYGSGGRGGVEYTGSSFSSPSSGNPGIIIVTEYYV